MSNVHASGADPHQAAPGASLADTHDAHGHGQAAHGHDPHGHTSGAPVAPPASGAVSILIGLLALAGILVAIGGFLNR